MECRLSDKSVSKFKMPVFDVPVLDRRLLSWGNRYQTVGHGEKITISNGGILYLKQFSTVNCSKHLKFLIVTALTS